MWIARDQNGQLHIYSVKPTKYEEIGEWGSIEKDFIYSEIDNFPEFDGVKWENDEPHQLILKTLKKK